jgi:O-antigen ligase
MEGLLWTFLVWIVLYAIGSRYRGRSPVVADWFSREHLALVLALLGTYSIAASAETAEVVRQPLVIERILRGGLAVAALLVIAPLLVRRIGAYTSGHRALGALVVYVLISLLSTLYSAAPLVTAAKVLELSAGLAPVAAVAIGPSPGRRLRNMLLLVIALAGSLVTAGVVGFVLLPSVFAGFESRPGFLLRQTLMAPFAHSNTMAAHGALMSVFGLAAFFTASLPRFLAVGAGVVGAAAVILSSGRQGVAMLLAGVAVVLWAKRRTVFLTLLAPAAVGTYFAFQDTIIGALSRNRPGNFTDFTGRLYWWEAALEAWSAHPWTGWGYGAGGRFVALASIGSGRVSSVHSGFIEALVGVGLLGMAALLYALFAVVKWSVKHLTSETALATLIIGLVLRTVVSQGFGGWLNVEFVLFALLAGIADLDRVEARSTRRTQPDLVMAP